jgi:hypothetical protein
MKGLCTMKNNLICRETILLLFLSTISCDGMDSNSPQVFGGYHSTNKKTPYITSSQSSIPRVASIDFLRGDAIPWSLRAYPCKDSKALGDLTVEHYGQPLNVAYIGTEFKEIKPGSDPGALNRWTSYINDFVRRNSQASIDEKHTQRAIQILHIIQATKTIRKTNDEDQEAITEQYLNFINIDDESRTSMENNLKPIAYGRVNSAIHEWQQNNSDRILEKMKSEFNKLSTQQLNEVLAQHKTKDIKKITHIHVNLAIQQWRENPSKNNLDRIYSELNKFSYDEQNEILTTHNLTRK